LGGIQEQGTKSRVSSGPCVRTDFQWIFIQAKEQLNCCELMPG
jgi:hypothetical protein